MTIICVDNKLDVHFYLNKNVDVISMQFIFDTGEIYETSKTLGMSHLLEHLLFESSPTYGSTLVDELNKRGIVYNAETNTHYVKYYFYGQTKYASFMLNVLLEMLDTQYITTSEFEKERNIVLEELQTIKDNPLHLLDDESMKCIYPNTILTKSISDIIKNTKKIKKGMIEQLHQKEYKLHKATLLICGNVHKNKMIEKIHQHIYRKPMGSYELPTIYIQQKFPIQKHIHNTQLHKTYCQLHFINHTPSSPYIIDIVSKYLQKRLFECLRKKSLLYGIKVYNDYTPYCSIVHINFNTNPEHFEKALTFVLHEIDKKKITKKIYMNVIQDIEMKLSALKGQDDIMNESNYYSDLIIYNKKIITPQKYYKKLLNISISQIEKYLHTHMNNIICITMGHQKPSINL